MSTKHQRPPAYDRAKFYELANTVQVYLPRAIWEDCSHPGQCGADVTYWVGILRPKLDKLLPETVRACLKCWGGWEEDELADHEANLRRFLWCAAGQIKNEVHQNARASYWTYMDAY
jgi:hypothetical protein